MTLKLTTLSSSDSSLLQISRINKMSIGTAPHRGGKVGIANEVNDLRIYKVEAQGSTGNVRKLLSRILTYDVKSKLDFLKVPPCLAAIFAVERYATSKELTCHRTSKLPMRAWKGAVGPFRLELEKMLMAAHTAKEYTGLSLSIYKGASLDGQHKDAQ